MRKSEVSSLWGNSIQIAERLGTVTSAAVRKWTEHGIPRGRQFEIAAKSNGVLKVDPEHLTAPDQEKAAYQ
jgi:hypothetical protein